MTQVFIAGFQHETNTFAHSLAYLPWRKLSPLMRTSA
jgi:hypothetical protein